MTDTEATQVKIEALLKDLLSDHDPQRDSAVDFLGAQFDLGLAWVHFPVGQGGLGLSPKFQGTIETTLRAAGATFVTQRNPIGIGMAAPTLVAFASDDQKQRYLRAIWTGEEIWCQLFSEPGAGSDVAGLSTRAEKDGDEWVINGQKVWTSNAREARRGLLLARTDPDVPKHQGLSYYVLDMTAPGVEVRPLRQMTGGGGFNEVFFTDARIPDTERLGDVGAGWKVAMTTLTNERVYIGGNVAERGSGFISDAMGIWRERGFGNPVKRNELAKLWIRAEALRLTNERARENRKSGAAGPEGSIGKLVHAELNQDITTFAIDLLGAEGTLYGSYTDSTPGPANGLSRQFLRSRANTIEGGTSEVMRNILGERVLGLPGDVRVDKTEPWSKLPHN